MQFARNVLGTEIGNGGAAGRCDCGRCARKRECDAKNLTILIHVACTFWQCRRPEHHVRSGFDRTRTIRAATHTLPTQTPVALSVFIGRVSSQNFIIGESRQKESRHEQKVVPEACHCGHSLRVRRERCGSSDRSACSHLGTGQPNQGCGKRSRQRRRGFIFRGSVNAKS